MGRHPRTERRTRPCAETRLDCWHTAGIRRRLTDGLRILAAIFAAFVVPGAFATPPAGTPVTNQATASFLDAASSSRSAQSNTELLTIGNPSASTESGPPVTLSLAASTTSVAPMFTVTYTVIAVNTG